MLSILINGRPADIQGVDFTVNLRSPVFTKNYRAEFAFDFRYPATPLNNSIFNYLNHLPNRTAVYDGYDVAVYFGGRLMFSGTQVIRKATPEFYEGPMLVGLSDFIFRAQKIMVNSLSLGGVITLPGVTTIAQYDTALLAEIPKNYRVARFAIAMVQNTGAYNPGQYDAALTCQNHIIIDQFGNLEFFKRPSTLYGVSDARIQTPFFYLHKIIALMFADLGFTVVKNEIESNDELARIIIYNNYNLYHDSRLGIFTITPKNHMPQISVDAFISQVSRYLNMNFLFNFRSRSVSIQRALGSGGSAPKVDITAQAIDPPVINMDTDAPEIIRFTHSVNPGDAYWAANIVGSGYATELWHRQVATTSALPVSAPKNTVYRVTSENSFYRFTPDYLGVSAWQKVGEDDKITELEVATGGVTSLMNQTVGTYYRNVLLPLVLEDETVRTTAVDMRVSNVFSNPLKYLHLLFWRGVQPGVPGDIGQTPHNYPTAHSDVRNSTAIIAGANYSLMLNNDVQLSGSGIITSQYKDLYPYYDNAPLIVEWQLRVDSSFIENFDWNTEYLINSVGYKAEEMQVKCSYSNTTGKLPVLIKLRKIFV